MKSFLSRTPLHHAILFLICLMPSAMFAQNSFSGILKDKSTGEPVDGAVITIDSSYYATLSNMEGRFSFSGINRSAISITINHLSYQPLKLNLIGGNEMTIELTPQTYLTEEVNVSATRANNQSMFAYTDLDKPEIEKNNLGQDLPLLLNLTPSVVTTSDGGNGIGYTGIRIRGSDATRVNVTINGIPVNDAESHQVYWVDLPDIASSVENIQVQRGVGNSTNGAGAFGGSINILSSKLDTKPFAQINSSAGSFNTFKNTVSFGTGLISDVFAVEGRLSKITSNGYIDRATSDLSSFYLSGGYYGKTNSLRAVVFSGKEKTYQAWYGVPGDSLATNRTYNPAGEYYDTLGNVFYYDNQTDNYQQDNYQLIYSHEFSKSLFANVALHYTRGKGYYEEYRPNDDLINYNLPISNVGDLIISSMDIVRQRWLSNHFYGATWSVEYDKNKINIRAGGALNRYTGDHYDEIIASQFMFWQEYPYRYSENEAEKTDASFFVRGLYDVDDKLSLSVDLQERMISYSFDGFDDNYIYGRQNEKMNFFNPKGGLSYQLSKYTQLYFSAGVGHKEPVRDDFVNSTPSKRPEAEFMIDYETGARFKMNNFSFSVNGYYMNYKSQLILTGKINDVGEYIRESVKDSYREGIEAEGRVIFNPHIYSFANISLSRNRIKNYREYVDDYDGGPQIVNEYNNTSISFSPAVTGAILIGFVPVRNFNLELTGKYAGKQFLDNTMNDSRMLDEYFVSDLHIAYSLYPGKIKEITFRFALYNITDAIYNSNGYTYSGYISGERNDYNYYFPQARVNWLGGIVVKI